RLDANTAHDLLLGQHQEEGISIDEENVAHDIIAWLITMPRPWRGEGQPDETYQRHQACSRELCELHMRLTQFPEDAEAHRRRDALLQEVSAEAWQELQRRKKEVAEGKRKSVYHQQGRE